MIGLTQKELEILKEVFKKFENIKLLEFLVIFELIFENVNIGLNLGMTKRTFKMRFFKSSDALDAFVLS